MVQITMGTYKEISNLPCNKKRHHRVLAVMPFLSACKIFCCCQSTDPFAKIAPSQCCLLQDIPYIVTDEYHGEPIYRAHYTGLMLLFIYEDIKLLLQNEKGNFIITLLFSKNPYGIIGAILHIVLQEKLLFPSFLRRIGRKNTNVSGIL